MNGTLKHRGPDDEGYYIGNTVALGHKRLSIIDLSSGKQPIFNENGSIAVIFNGEIYNYKSLRDDLQASGHIFRTQSDTEVIVHLYEEHGEEFLKHLRGMFAIALWNDIEKTLILARDRLGIKPLYYSSSGRSLVFASEIKAILADKEFADVEVDLEALDMFLCFHYTPGQNTLFKNIHKLPPGWYLRICNGKAVAKEYWDLRYGQEHSEKSLSQLTGELDQILRETVRDHMISDVPVGLLLSGGVDSTALLHYAVEQTDKDVSSFTIGFSGQNFADERKYARLAAGKYGTKHFEMSLTAADFMSFLPKYVWHMEEPVCEPPAIALYYITKLASQYVKVLISGEGADEAFAGYPNYHNYLTAEKIKAYFPLSKYIFRSILRTSIIDERFPRLYKYNHIFSLPLESYYKSRTSGPFALFNSKYANLYSDDLMAVHKNNSIHSTFASKYFGKQNVKGILNRMLYVDTKTWLPDDLLIKADKTTMANSVELRVPFLDHKVMEFAANIPAELKIRGRKKKYILKETFRGILPSEILDRKKTGFPVPYEEWIRKDHADIVRDVLLDDSTLRRRYFNKKGIEWILSRNKAYNIFSKEIFSLFVLEIWHRVFYDNKASENSCF